MTAMTKYRIVLDLQAEGRKPVDDPDHPADDKVWFEQSESMHPTRISIERETWEELGSPAVVTMTLQPGDWLDVPK